MSTTDITESVKEYYGKVLKSSDDLQTTACKTPLTGIPKHVRQALADVHEDVAGRYYGCGIVVPDCLIGTTIIDLGSGSGRDCYALSKLVSEDGHVIGIDMTDEQVDFSNQYLDYHKEKFGYLKGNVKFVKGYIEKLNEVGIDDESVDVVISNCVINLCKDKRSVLREVFRVLKSGGELYFSDVYCDRDLEDSIRNHRLLWNECVSGALWWEELNKIAIEVGFETPRIFSAHSFEITKPELKEVVGDAKFVSVLYRLFKLNKTQKEEEKKDVIYRGGVESCSNQLKFDYKTIFQSDNPKSIDAATWNIINQSRFKDYFESKKASCCYKPDLTKVENPFEVVKENGFVKPTGGCC